MKKRLLSFLFLLFVLSGILLTTACRDSKASTASAEEVDALIAEIDGATLANEAKIDKAYLAYCALSEEERAKVNGFETLQEYRRELTKAYAVKEYVSNRMPLNELLIGAYRVPATNETNLQALLDCHFDFIWNADTSVLDLVAEKGLGVIQRTSSFDGIVWGTEGQTEEDFRASLEGLVCDHPTVWAIDHTDEPHGQQIVDY